MTCKTVVTWPLPVLGPVAVQNYVVVVALGGAIIFLIFLLLRRGLNRNDRLGPMQWNPNKSWVSTITAAGAILGTVFSTSGIFPADYQMTLLCKPGYASLSVFFGMLPALAALLYNGVRTSARGDYVGNFLAVSLITLSGVFGQVATLGLLVFEMVSGHAITRFLAAIFGVFLVGALLWIATYAFYSMCAILSDRELAKPKAGVKKELSTPQPWSLI
jgi:hypothetical protein